MSLVKNIFIIAFLFSVCLPVMAQETSQVGQATIDIKGKKPKSTEVRVAKKKAQIKALERFLANDQSKIRLYDRCLRKGIEDRLKDFIDAAHVVREDTDKSARQYSVTLKVSINSVRLDNVLEGECKGPATEKGRISFVFLTRQQVSSDGYKVPKSNRSVENTLKEVFLNNTFKVVSNNRLEKANRQFKKSEMEQEYVDSGEIQWSIAEEAVARVNSDYFAFGTFDIRQAGTDDVTGKQAVSVVVTAELIDLTNEDTLAVIGDIQERAIAESDDEAATKALKAAADKLAKRMVSQLNAQRIH